MSEIQIIIVAVGAFVFIALCALALVVVARLRRLAQSQFEAIDNLIGTLRAAQQTQPPREPDIKS